MPDFYVTTDNSWVLFPRKLWLFLISAAVFYFPVEDICFFSLQVIADIFYQEYGYFFGTRKVLFSYIFQTITVFPTRQRLFFQPDNRCFYSPQQRQFFKYLLRQRMFLISSQTVFYFPQTIALFSFHPRQQLYSGSSQTTTVFFFNPDKKTVCYSYPDYRGAEWTFNNNLLESFLTLLPCKTNE